MKILKEALRTSGCLWQLASLASRVYIFKERDWRKRLYEDIEGRYQNEWRREYTYSKEEIEGRDCMKILKENLRTSGVASVYMLKEDIGGRD